MRHLTIVRCTVNKFDDNICGVSSSKTRHVICSRVAQILREEREKQGLSMNMLADKAGLSQQMISYVERELRNPSLDTLLLITEALELDLWRVLKKAAEA